MYICGTKLAGFIFRFSLKNSVSLLYLKREFAHVETFRNTVCELEHTYQSLFQQEFISDWQRCVSGNVRNVPFYPK